MEEKEIFETQEQKERIYMLVALRGKVLFPKTMLNFEVGRPKSIEAVNRAMAEKSEILIAPQKNAFIENPNKEEILDVGVIAHIKQVVKGQGSSMKVVVQALRRAKITSYVSESEYFAVTVKESPYIVPEDPLEMEACLRVVKNCFAEYSLLEKRLNKEMLALFGSITDVNEYIDNALSTVNFKEEDIQNILRLDDTLERVKAFEELFRKESEIAKLERKIAGKVRTSIDKSQKEFYLREQIKAIHDELGDNADEIEELTETIKSKCLPKDREEKASKEIARLFYKMHL